jgi:hypothetical protein
MTDFLVRLKKHLRRHYQIREIKKRIRQEERKNVPRVWLSPSKIIEMDLDLYFNEQGPGQFKDEKLLNDLAKSRDDCLSIVKKQLLVSAGISALLLSSYFSAGVDQINLGILTLKIGKGVQEALLLFQSALSMYILLVQSNATALDAAIRTMIKNTITPELQSLYEIRYFPHQAFSNFKPFNLPHITMTKFTIFVLFRAAPILFLSLLCCGLLAWLGTWFVLVFDVWSKARLGIWSQLTVAITLFVQFYGFVFLVSRSAKMPYNDYTINHEYELLKQVAPEKMNRHLSQRYGRTNRLVRLMRRLKDKKL